MVRGEILKTVLKFAKFNKTPRLSVHLERKQ